jgi:hypothetical protein
MENNLMADDKKPREFKVCGEPVEIHEWICGEFGPDQPEWWEIDSLEGDHELLLVEKSAYQALKEKLNQGKQLMDADNKLIRDLEEKLKAARAEIEDMQRIMRENLDAAVREALKGTK